MRQIAILAAQEGGRILLEKFGKLQRIDRKGEVDLVTEADRAAEEAIVGLIRGTFPRHDILAEEKDHGHSDSPYRWIIDPLDGTTNYAHGIPWFAVSIALELEGTVVLGLVYNPIANQMFYAEKGRGAFLNDLPLQISTTDRLDQALLATGFPYDRKTSQVNNFDHFLHFQQRAQACRRFGSAALDLALTAAGRFDGFWELKLKPWDVAAGQLLVSEAGGRVSRFDGSPVDIYAPDILASNGSLHGDMIAVLAEGRNPS